MMPIIDDKEIAKILVEAPGTRKWRAHGNGFMKTELGGGWRLHVFHSFLWLPTVSAVHDHPWSLLSYVRAGQLTNRRWLPSRKGSTGAIAFQKGEIHCTNYKGLETDPELVYLYGCAPEVYHAAGVYAQTPAEIHDTTAINGTVTLIHRGPVTDGKARIFWPVGKEYGDAARDLSDDEYRIAAGAALKRLG